MAQSDAGFLLLVRYPQYGKVWIGNTISSFGDQMGWIALVWLVLHRTGDASSVGWVTLLYQLPSVVTGPLAGVLLDRFPRGRVMAIGNLIMALLFLSIGGLASSSLASHGQNVWFIYTLVGLAGIVLPLNTTGGGALMTDLVPSDRLGQANYLMQAEWQLAMVLGPALGGVLIGMVGTQVLILVDAASFLLAAFILFRLPVIHTHANARDASPWRDFLKGLHYLRGNRPLVALAVLTVLFNLLYGPYEVILPVLAKTVYRSSGSLGLLWTMFAVGSIAGSLVFAQKKWNHSMSTALATIIVLWGTVTVGMALSHALWLTAGIMFVAGIVFSPWGALVMTIRQKMIPPTLQGRVIGTTMSLTIVAGPMGAWTTGFLLGSVSAEQIFLVSGFGTVLVGLLAFWWPSFRSLDSQ